MPKLYQIPEQSKIKCDCSDGSKYIIFHHIDGMYSFCKTAKGNPVHLKAWADLQKIGNYYIIEK